MSEKVDKELVKKIADLARITLTEEEVELYATQLSKILDYMEQLNELDTTNVEPVSHVQNVVNVFREDKVKKSLDIKEVLQNAPEKEGSFFKVPGVIKKN
ncbi:MAG: Asp-tRNA(Asn)/Glu-tRNA(Gln) amidotransferase subunit GatC [Candidatus Marinimicrobia bacterium]|nr:Asp-tRNA(Asn)/Glu-tRNA(Gln) amidotransferase subunit GatC [Candidatus Neomarinimicrobiota bacterium]